MPSDEQTKRKASDAPVSPPPLKRKVQSGTTSECAILRNSTVYELSWLRHGGCD